ncbi:MAG: WYL domain-containing protein [Acidobacteriota bacterium]|nr:WYL domain-containing protein [Blastocatellia bacterium]MDW8241535.1 WYL domain-containing protein [Acidobacteriota bacterium]
MQQLVCERHGLSGSTRIADQRRLTGVTLRGTEPLNALPVNGVIGRENGPQWRHRRSFFCCQSRRWWTEVEIVSFRVVNKNPILATMKPSTSQSKKDRFARLIRLAVEIKTNPQQRPEDLWRRLGVGRSQFFQDCRALNEIGLEFKYDRRERRYQIIKDLFIPVFDLTVTEAISLALMVRQLSATGDHTLAWDAVTAVRKVIANAPEPARDMLAHAMNEITLRKRFQVNPRIMEALWRAQQERRRVRVLYDDYSVGKERWLQADVYMVYFKGRALYVDVFLPDEQRVAMLRASRIKQVELQALRFQVRPDYDFHKRHQPSFRVLVSDSPPQRVRIRFDARTARYIREAYWHDSQRMLEGDDGGLILELTVSEPREVLWYLVFPWAEGAEILEPPWLRQEAAKLAEKIYEQYTKPKR